MENKSVPVHYTQDPWHRATKIECEVCNVCEWAKLPIVGRCIYGGQFGYAAADAGRAGRRG